jgi:two-component system, cell cycle response regulator DivK
MASKILYIEDNPYAVQLVRDVMEIYGYELIEAYDGLTGVAVAARERPDLILMDINLPGIDGLEATSRLKAAPELSYIPVIAVTANTSYGDRQRCIEAGCDGYVPKPVSIRDLMDTVRCFLAGTPSEAASGASAFSASK